MKPTTMISKNVLFAVAIICLGVTQASAQTIKPATRITQPVNAAILVTLHGNTHPLANAKFDRGSAPASLALDHMQLVLTRSPQQEAALQTLLAQQQDTSSPNFHKWLTPDEFGQQFGAADSDIQTITAWLQSGGFQIDGVATGKNIIEFSGNAGEVQSAFHTAIHRYVLTNGEEHWANSGDPQIPAALATVVAGVNSMNNFSKHRMSRLKATIANSNSAAKLQSPAHEVTVPNGGCEGSGTPCYLIGPTDFATIYNILPLWNAGIDGTGQTIGIVSDSDININDANAFRTAFSLPSNPPHTILNNGAAPGGTDPGIQTCASGGDECEAILDVEWAGGVAKGATIDLFVAASTSSSFGGDLSAQYVVNTSSVAQTVSVLSYSYGACELALGTAGNQFYNSLWSQAASEGITVVVSTDDSGSAGCDTPDYSIAAAQPANFGLAVNGLASTPYNVSVGGTDFNDLTNPTSYFSATNSGGINSALGYIPETTYNDSCTNSLLFNTPRFWIWGTFGTAEAACNSSVLAGYDVVLPSGGGGGVSNCTVNSTTSTTVGQVSSCSGGYAKPSWQAGPGVPADGLRDLPDVSFFAGDGTIQNYYVLCEADITNGLLCNGADQLDTFNGGGGTSAAVQAFAGISALINQKSASRQGNLNMALYPLAAAQASAGTNCNASNSPVVAACMFYDVTSGTIATPCALNSPNCTVIDAGDQIGILGTGAGLQNGFNAGVGYDQATGLGSMNVANLANAIGHSFVLSSPNPTVTISSPGASNTMSFTVAGVSGFTGTVALACSNLPSSSSCTFSPTSVNLSSTTTSVPVTVTVKTQAAGSMIAPSIFSPAQPPDVGFFTRFNNGEIALLLSLSLGLLLVGLVRRQFRWSMIYAVGAFGSLLAIASCGSTGSAGSTATPTPIAMVSPTSLTFASQNVNTNSASQNITLSNTGTAALSITGISASGQFAESNSCGSSVASGSNCTIQVTFDPTAAGAQTGTLSIQDNAAGSPQSVSLTGTGATSGGGGSAGTPTGTTTATVTGTSGTSSFPLSFTVTVQ